MFRLFGKRKDATESKKKNEPIPQRKGLFAEAWNLFKSSESSDFFDEGITLDECLFREEDGMMDIFVTRNGQFICFNLDNETILLSDNVDEDETLELTSFADLENLRSHMNHFVMTHT